MKVLSLDLETTGLDIKRCEILEIAGVAYDIARDEVIAEFHRIVNPGVITYGEIGALCMHAELLGDIKRGCGVSSTLAFADFEEFCKTYFDGPVTLTGKNVGTFDLPILQRFVTTKFRHRVLDVGSLYCLPRTVVPASVPHGVPTLGGDDVIPNMDLCLSRAGITDCGGQHRALTDARMVVDLLRRYYK